ncbi:hypothetical protein GLOIN_2v967084 [Rhizophagus clarus]|uniref:Uncharacterized protein n=1 Tax=Rhizophagus clarus TaxID=94130 RepID=A0A8H3LXA5_9GLOM|nr:hypothetical protein GLOIN_2v967084 [Rhizophagus clarus]
METNENVVTKDYVTSSDQSETKMNVYNNKLVDNQTKEFDESCLDKIQTNEIIEVENVFFEIEKIHKKYDEKINSQSQLIDSLKARIEELEVDSLIKNQEIKKIQEEFISIKKEIQSVLGKPMQDNKENISSIKDGNINDSGILGLNNHNNNNHHYENEETRKISFNYKLEKEQRKSSAFGKIQNEDNSRVVASSSSKLPLISMVNVFIKNRQVHSKIIATINNFKSKNKKINDDESKGCFKNILMIH